MLKPFKTYKPWLSLQTLLTLLTAGVTVCAEPGTLLPPPAPLRLTALSLGPQWSGAGAIQLAMKEGISVNTGVGVIYDIWDPKVAHDHMSNMLMLFQSHAL